MPGIWRLVYIIMLHRTPWCITWCVSGCKRAGHDGQCERVTLDERWHHQSWPVLLVAWEEGQMSPVKMFCCGYKAGGTTGVKGIIWLKGLWTGCMRWADQLLHTCTLRGRLKTKPGSPCILKLCNVPWNPCYPQRLLTWPVAFHNCSTSTFCLVSNPSLIAFLTT